MKEIKAFKDALHTASNDTARVMTAHLRAEANASGWHDDVVRHLNVSHSKGSFDVNSHDDHKSHVYDLEYGTPDHRPTAAIRRFDNRPHQAEKFLVTRLSKILGDV